MTKTSGERNLLSRFNSRKSLRMKIFLSYKRRTLSNLRKIKRSSWARKNSRLCLRANPKKSPNKLSKTNGQISRCRRKKTPRNWNQSFTKSREPERSNVNRSTIETRLWSKQRQTKVTKTNMTTSNQTRKRTKRSLNQRHLSLRSTFLAKERLLISIQTISRRLKIFIPNPSLKNSSNNPAVCSTVWWSTKAGKRRNRS